MKPNKLRTIALLVTASVLLGAGTAYAATQTVTSSIKYLTDLSFATVLSPNFGEVKQGVVGSTYTLSTAGAVTPGSGGAIEGGTANAGDYTIIGSTGSVINITAGSYTKVGGSTPSAAVCKYNGGADVPGCSIVGAAAPGAGADLKVGLTITSDGLTLDGITDSPTFVLTVLYQ
jgi:hypothetical protein